MARRIALLLVLMSWSPVPIGAGGQSAAPDLKGLLETYERGHFDEAVARAAAIDDLGPMRLRFVQDTPLWINSDPALAARRRAAAAAFLLELAHARLESDWGRLSDLIEWMCVQLRSAGPPGRFELAWHHASLALAGRARVRLWLLGEYARLPHQPVRRRPPSKNPNPSPMHLVHALERYPDDPQLRLGQIVAWTWGRDQEPIRNLHNGDAPPRTITARPLQIEAVTALEPLTSDPLVGAEAFLRSGIVHFTVEDHAAAVKALDAAHRRATDTSIRYLALFYAGRALEALGRGDEAVVRFTQALDVIPTAESGVVALASLHFIQDNREAALALLDRAFAKRSTETDPGRLAGYGSFMRWPELEAAMRQELPK